MSDAAAAEESYGTGRTSRPLKGPCAAFGHCRLHRRDHASADAQASAPALRGELPMGRRGYT